MCEKVKIKFYGTSQNKKTGNISQIYSSCKTCPVGCTMRPYCYGKSGPVRLHWDRVEKDGYYIEDLKSVIESVPHSNVVRLNVVGDIAVPGTDNINKESVNTFCETFKSLGILGYTYTHCDAYNKQNVDIVKKASNNNLVINFSCETLEKVKHCKENNVNAVLTVNTISKRYLVKDGIKFLQCPATFDKKITCKTCKLCLQKERESVIVFPVHGNKKTKAKESGMLIDL